MFFTPALGDDLSQESEKQKSLQDSSKYFGRSLKWCSLDGLD